MKNMKYALANVALFACLVSSIPASAAQLGKLGLTNTCTSDDLATDPVAQRSILIEPRWKSHLQTPDALKLFDFDAVDKEKRAAKATRESVTSSHIVNMLADEFKKVRAKEIELIQQGKLLPVEEGKSYSYEELEKRKQSVEAFKQQYVEPVLRDSYRFYLDTMNQRDQIRAEKRDNAAVNALLSRVEKQRQFLNAALNNTLPSIAQKLGTIPAGDINHLPFSYRDGEIVTIRLQKETGSISIYPRMLMNQLAGEDEYFLQALELWRNYCRSQYEAEAQSGAPIPDMMGGVVSIDLSQLPEVQLRKRAYEQAESDLVSAQRIHELLKTLTESEIYSLLDLFRALGYNNIPQCEAVIHKMNENIAASLHGERNSNSKRLSKAEKAKIDQYGKDVVFYQDFYEVYSQAASIMIKRSLGRN